MSLSNLQKSCMLVNISGFTVSNESSGKRVNTYEKYLNLCTFPPHLIFSRCTENRKPLTSRHQKL